MFLQHSIGTSRHTHILEPLYEVSEEASAEALDAFGRMASGEPIQYIIGKAYFYDREFKVTPDVLIPRPETELLVREAVNWARRSGRKSLRVLDLCTGSGCIAWSMALELPGSEVTAVDISDGALAVAAGQEFESDNAPKFIKADVLAGPVEGLGTFDMILSNPPYVMDSEKALMRKNVLDHEPWLALFVSDEDPLVFYQAVAAWAQHLLKSDGLCLVEINESLGRQTAKVFEDTGFRDVEVLQDLNSRDRFIRAIQ
jgi:release factor glutamine methyltransferase